MTAKDIHQRMLAAYAVCDSYTDEGIVDGPLGRHWFTTEFRRPDQLFLTYGGWSGETRVPEFRLSHVSSSTHVWRSRDQETEECESLDLAVAALTGVTSGVSHRVPPLLLGQLSGRTLRELTRLELCGTETLNAAACYIVEGVYRDRTDCRERLWIGKRVPFLARNVTEVKTEAFSGQFVIDYRAKGA